MSKPFFISGHLNIVTQNISKNGSFIKLLNGHLEMKKGFDLKILMK
jgi:hypothetical protein